MQPQRLQFGYHRMTLGQLAFAAFADRPSPGVTTRHKIVCEMATQLALPIVRAEIRRLLKADKLYDYFSDSCTFPDHPHVRKNALRQPAAGLARPRRRQMPARR
jgi:hypothetical protein